jgi:dihydrofolate reductase
MAKLSCFMTLSLDGYFARTNGDMIWAHREDPEFSAFVARNAQSDGALLFGRVTYEMMASYWPTGAAHANAPEVAEGMNRAAKYVVSRTLERVSWSNTTLLEGELESGVAKLKRESERPIVTLGSASLVKALAEAALLDEYLIVVGPIALGAGRSLFAGMKRDLGLQLVETRRFANGNVFLRYTPER